MGQGFYEDKTDILTKSRNKKQRENIASKFKQGLWCQA